MREFQAIIKTPITDLYLGISVNSSLSQVRRIEFLPGCYEPYIQSGQFTQYTVNQIYGYFDDPAKQIQLATQECGTDFQKKVWQALKQIPQGAVMTYGQLAAQLASSPRAVGNACRVNPVPIIVPCHRVVAQNGYGGFAGEVNGVLVKFKRWLLAHEG